MRLIKYSRKCDLSEVTQCSTQVNMQDSGSITDSPLIAGPWRHFEYRGISELVCSDQAKLYFPIRLTLLKQVTNRILRYSH
jgi:hypothetical protein